MSWFISMKYFEPNKQVLAKFSLTYDEIDEASPEEIIDIFKKTLKKDKFALYQLQLKNDNIKWKMKQYYKLHSSLSSKELIDYFLRLPIAMNITTTGRLYKYLHIFTHQQSPLIEVHLMEAALKRAKLH